MDKEFFSSQDQTRQLIIEDRLISSMRLFHDHYSKIWLTIIGWMLTINAGGIVAVLSYWAAKKNPPSIECMYLAFGWFTVGLAAVLFCLVINLFLAMIMIYGYKKYTDDVLANTRDLRSAFVLPWYGKILEYLAWFSGIGSFVCILLGMYFGCKSINLF